MDNKIFFIREIVSPERARELLDISAKTNFQNRNLSSHLVNRYASDMKEGKWQPTGQTISIASDGAIIDGQHRLNAIVKAGVPVEINFIRNVSKQTFDCYDIGKIRTNKDILNIAGYDKYAHAITGGLGLLVSYLINGNNAFLRNKFTQRRRYFYIFEPILKIYYQKLTEGACWYSTSNNQRLISQGSSVFFYFIFTFINDEKGCLFFQKIKEGTGLEKGDPVFALRTTLLNIKLSKYKRLNLEPEAYYIIKAWNKFYKNEKISGFNYSKAEKFPDIYGFDRIKFIDTLNLTPEQKSFYQPVDK